jgi:DNA mismatch repair protein MutS2
MIHSSAELLEFEAVRGLVARHVFSSAGRVALAAIVPAADRPALEALHAETAEAIAYQDAASRSQVAQRGAAIRLRFDSLPDVTAALSKLGVSGAVLEGIEIRELVALLDRACDVRAVLTAAAGRFPLLAAKAGRIAEFRPLLREVTGKVEPDGTVADHASPALHRVRRDVERQHRLIQESLERFQRAHRDDGILQEEFVAIRNERFVLPVVAGKQARIPGIIHAASGTGHTLFVEPLETVALNNDLVRLREQERREVFRILEEITGRFRAARDDVSGSVCTMTEIELIFAKASFAAEFACVIPTFSGPESPRMSVEEARHPLLMDVLRRQNKKVVPLSLTLEGSQRTLLISGPNTGGKTVALKTIGVIVLMAQSGLPVPCSQAHLPLFEQVLADIGDHQSLEQSLSTFSAHIARIREMMSALGPRSLVLMDELGRATDPDEGGALGVAILNHMRLAGAFTLASTHLLAPKIYAATAEGVLNASMSFDEQTLAPTYVLRTGIPGASAGLDIAQRHGLPAALVEQARASLPGDRRDFNRLLKLLEERLELATRLARELDAAKQALEAERAALHTQWEKRESAKLAEMERRTEMLLRDFERTARQTIDRLTEEAGNRKFASQAAVQVARASREMREQAASALSPARPQDAATVPGGIGEGVRVRLRGVREPARVRRLLGEHAIEVEAGFLKLQVSRDDVIEVLPEKPEPAKLPTGISLSVTPRQESVPHEINLIGRRAEEALAEADKFLDTASLASVQRVRIVHGHGLGVLKRAIAGMLKDHPLVEKFYEAPPQEGGAGATIVELRAD